MFIEDFMINTGKGGFFLLILRDWGNQPLADCYFFSTLSKIEMLPYHFVQ